MDTNIQPWCIRTTLEPVELPSQGQEGDIKKRQEEVKKGATQYL